MDAREKMKDTAKVVGEKVEDAARAVADKAAALLEQPIPGSPGSGTPTVEEATESREPLPPKDDQAQPRPMSPTGAESADPPAGLAPLDDFRNARPA